MANYAKVQQLIQGAINLNREIYSDIPASILNSVTPIQSAINFTTVTFDIGRRTGKTAFAAQFPDAWIITTKPMKRVLNGRTANPVYTAKQVRKGAPRGPLPTLLVFDGLGADVHKILMYMNIDYGQHILIFP